MLPAQFALEMDKGTFVFGPSGGYFYIITINGIPKHILKKAKTITSANYAKLSDFILSRVTTSSMV